MSGRRFGNTTLAVAVPLVILAAAGLAVVAFRPANKSVVNTANTTNPNRQQYASLYDGAWRQDDGHDTTLVTATLFVPPTIAALGRDDGRSVSEEQIWNVVKDLDAKTVPILLTFDSVNGSLSDDAIQKSLSLSAESGEKFTVQSWQPMIAPTRIVNTPANASSQLGVAVFSAERDVDWQKIGTLTMTVTGIGGEKTRTFSWAEPRLLLDL